MEGYILQWTDKAWGKVKQASNRQKTMEGSDGGLHPAVDGQILRKGNMTGRLGFNPLTLRS